MNTTDLKLDRSALEAELVALGTQFKGKVCKCPFHEDNHASAGIFQGDDGAWRFKCQVPSCGFGGDIFDVRARATGKTVADVLREHNANTAPPRAAAAPTKPPITYPTVEALCQVCGATDHYVYTNPDTKLADLVVIRRDLPEGGKKFIQCHQTAGGFVMKAPEKPWPLFNRTRIRATDTVVFVEGEKAAKALQLVGIVATTTPAGAGKASYADLSPLAGKHVHLWPDADPPNDDGKRTGIEHMREVAGLLERLQPPPSLHWVDCDTLNLPPKGDAYDFLEQRQSFSKDEKRDAVLAVLERSTALGASGDVSRIVEDEISGKRRTLAWPWKFLTNTTQSLMPGMITVLAGSPGSSKSLILLQAVAYWSGEGEKVAIFELEHDRSFHLRRALAQYTGVANLTNVQWVHEHPDEALSLLDQGKDFMDNLGRKIYDTPAKQTTLRELSDWIEQQAKAGTRLLCIDPITAAKSVDKPWIEDQEFMFKAKKTLTEYGCSLILVTHPRKGAKNSGMDDMASGAAYSRFSQTVLWLERFDELRDMEIITSQNSLYGDSLPFTENMQVGRVLKILKATNGIGAGKSIGFSFEHESLRFNELGLVVRKKQGQSKKVRVA